MTSTGSSPALNIPVGSACCDVSIIDTTCSLVIPTWISVGPVIPGHEWLNVPVYAFHITHQPSGRQILFDLGCRKDWHNLVTPTVDLIANNWPGIKIDKDIVEILKEGGVSFGGDQGIDAVILSHSHFDHIGDISSLPKDVDLIVGPTFKEVMMPAFPENEQSAFFSADFEGRKVFEVPFDEKDVIGRFQSYDYFGDGSLQILDAPGHAPGHICALARTTADTYALLGGDTSHFVGAMRPTKYLPMPDPLPAATALDKRIITPCPCSIFTACHPTPEKSRTTPFYDLSSTTPSAFPDHATSMESLGKLEEFDADPNILVIIAHDTAPLDVMTFFPRENLNNWKAQGWKDQMHWHFVNELPVDGAVGRKPLVDGIYKEGGTRVKTLEGKKV